MVSCLLLYWLLSSIDLREVPAVLGNASLGYLPLVPLPMFGRLYFYALRWDILLRHYGMRLAFRQRYAYYVVGFFFNACLPGSLGGDAVRVLCASRALGRKYVSIATIAVLERFFGLCAILVVGSAGFLLGYEVLSGIIPREVHRPLFGLCLLFVVALLFFKPLASLAADLVARTNRFERVQTFLKETSRLGRGELGLLLLLSALGQFTGMLSAIILLHALHLAVPFMGYLVVFAVMSVIALIPISLGGLGVREGLLTVLLAGFGISPGAAVSLALATYLNRIVVGAAGGVLYVFVKQDAAFGNKEVGSET